jgi:hypothetical protein
MVEGRDGIYAMDQPAFCFVKTPARPVALLALEATRTTRLTLAASECQDGGLQHDSHGGAQKDHAVMTSSDQLKLSQCALACFTEPFPFCRGGSARHSRAWVGVKTFCSNTKAHPPPAALSTAKP